MLILVQVFNWFPAKHIHVIMAIWTMMQALGYITQILIDQDHNYFKLFMVGPLFLLLAVFD